MHTLQLRIEAADRNRPGLVAVGLGQVAAAASVQLVVQQRQKGLRPAAEVKHAVRDAGRLAPDGDRDSALGFGGSSKESLPGRPPSGPNSSPATSTCDAPIPRRQSSAKIQRAESALSVSPISTCFASLVTFGV